MLVCMQRLLVTVCAAAGCSSGSDAAKSADAPIQSSGGDAAVPGDGSTLPSDGSTPNDGGASSAIAITSTAFVEGGAIPVAHTCNDPAGVNTSPALAWTGAPAGTQSFAVVLTDLSTATPLVHWVIYDIPSTANGLPEHVENAYAPANVPSAHQAVSVHAPTVGYYGPCPPQPPAHSYQFAVHALDVAVLPGATMQTSRTDAVTVIKAHELAVANVTGKYTK